MSSHSFRTLLNLAVIVVFLIAGSGAHKDTQCSLLGHWTPTAPSFILLPDNQFYLLPNGMMHGTVTYPVFPKPNCSFVGTWKVSQLDGLFQWDNVALTDCLNVDEFFVDRAIGQLFCDPSSPNYSSQTLAEPFTAGCFVVFNDDCSGVQFTHFNGRNAGVQGINTWQFAGPVPQTHKGQKFKYAPDPPTCSIVGVQASSELVNYESGNFKVVADSFPGAIGAIPKARYTNTAFNVSFHKDGSYVSSIHHYNSSTGKEDCFVAFKGRYSVGPRMDSAPAVAGYQYTSSSVLARSAAEGSYCNYTYLHDPVSCEYLTTTTYSQTILEASTCYLIWDNNPDVPACTYFRLDAPWPYRDQGLVGPAFKVQGKHKEHPKHPGNDDASFDLEESAITTDSSAAQLSTVLPLLFSLMLYIIGV